MNQPIQSRIVIAVCLKQASLVCGRTGREIDTCFVDPMIDRVTLNNPLDEAALAHAAIIKADIQDARIVALYLGETIVKREAARAAALGADEFIWLNDPDWRGLDAKQTAAVLYAAVKKCAAALVMCGARSHDLGRGEVGAYLAFKLGWPYVHGLAEVQEGSRAKRLSLLRNLGQGDKVRLEARLPLVAAVEKGPAMSKRPPRADMLRALETGVTKWGAAELDAVRAGENKTQTNAELRPPKPCPKHIPPIDGSLPAQERIDRLLSGRSQTKETKILAGGPEELGSALVDYLALKGCMQKTGLKGKG